MRRYNLDMDIIRCKLLKKLRVQANNKMKSTVLLIFFEHVDAFAYVAWVCLKQKERKISSP